MLVVARHMRGRVRSSAYALGAALAALLLAAIWTGPARAAGETITFFSSHVSVQRDGSVRVTETITVKCRGRLVRQGIRREFPARYVTRLGQELRLRIRVRQVLRNGEEETFTLVRGSDETVLATGRQGELLEWGEHTYTLVYEADRQVAHHERLDELFWPVTGYGWELIIDQAEAVVELPVLAGIQDAGAYTGSQGAGGRDFHMEYDAGGNPVFVTTRRIYPGDGLSVRLTWPKGFVIRPDFMTRTFYSLRNHFFVYVAALLLLVSLWRLRVRLRGAEPSQVRLSPALADLAAHGCLTEASALGALIGLAQARALRIDAGGNGLTLAKGERSPVDGLGPGQDRWQWFGLAEFGTGLFARGSEVPLQGPSTALARALNLLERAARKDLGRKIRAVLRLRELYAAPWLVVACLGLSATEPWFGVGVALALAGAIVLGYGVVGWFFRSWGRVLRNRPGSLLSALAASAILVPVVSGGLVGGWFFVQEFSWIAYLLFAGAMGGTMWLPWRWARHKVLRGPQAEAAIAGLRREFAGAEYQDRPLWESSLGIAVYAPVLGMLDAGTRELAEGVARALGAEPRSTA
ncbi:MAG: DUF2207 domain-containing protein [Desulfovibrio sp.]|nr:MAG: DUF2207 domain-containing protein [Desulfovibrio sp.]